MRTSGSRSWLQEGGVVTLCPLWVFSTTCFWLVNSLQYLPLIGQTGVYDLVSFSDSYEDFLTTMGIPSWVVFIIVRASETLEMEMVDDNTVRSRVITGDWEQGQGWRTCHITAFTFIHNPLQISRHLSTFTSSGSGGRWSTGGGWGSCTSTAAGRRAISFSAGDTLSMLLLLDIFQWYLTYIYCIFTSHCENRLYYYYVIGLKSEKKAGWYHQNWPSQTEALWMREYGTEVMGRI